MFDIQNEFLLDLGFKITFQISPPLVSFPQIF